MGAGGPRAPRSACRRPRDPKVGRPPGHRAPGTLPRLSSLSAPRVYHRPGDSGSFQNPTPEGWLVGCTWRSELREIRPRQGQSAVAVYVSVLACVKCGCSSSCSAHEWTCPLLRDRAGAETRSRHRARGRCVPRRAALEVLEFAKHAFIRSLCRARARSRPAGSPAPAAAYRSSSTNRRVPGCIRSEACSVCAMCDTSMMSARPPCAFRQRAHDSR